MIPKYHTTLFLFDTVDDMLDDLPMCCLSEGYPAPAHQASSDTYLHTVYKIDKERLFELNSITKPTNKVDEITGKVVPFLEPTPIRKAKRPKRVTNR